MKTGTCVIFNPVARGEKAQRFRERLGVLSQQCSLCPTTSVGSARTLAAAAVRDGAEIVVAAGGDGTINEVLNGIADESQGLERVRLGILPIGTANAFARELRIPRNLEQAWAIIMAANETRIDLARMEFSTSSGTQQRYFAQLAGAGWDAFAVENVNWNWKKRIGGLAYVAAALKFMVQPLPQIDVSDGVMTLRGEMVLFGNGQLYGGNFRVFPRADLRDGLLEVTVLPRVKPIPVLRGAYGVVFNSLYSTGGAKHLRGSSFSMKSADRVPLHVEGENVGYLPARCWVEPNALRVIVPPERT